MTELEAMLGHAFLEAIRQAVRAEIQPLVSAGPNGHAPASLLTVEELHVALKVPKSWIYDRTRRKENPIPHFKVGRYPRFDLTEIKAWLKDQKEIS